MRLSFFNLDEGAISMTGVSVAMAGDSQTAKDGDKRPPAWDLCPHAQ